MEYFCAAGAVNPTVCAPAEPVSALYPAYTVYVAASRKYRDSDMADPLMVRHVRVAPSVAVQSSQPHWMAEFAAHVNANDGAPERTFVFAVTPTPPWFRHTVTAKDHSLAAVQVALTVTPVAVPVTGIVHKSISQ
jgi:hypothetical protein